MAALSDIVLVAQVAISGNNRAFDELVRRYQSPIRRFFLHQTLGDEALSDDLAQETFIKAYTNIRSFKGLASFQTWLMRIAYNVHYDYCRKEQTHPQRLPISGGSGYSQDGSQSADRLSAPLSHREGMGVGLRMDLYAALALLKPDERTCITMQLIDGYDIAGIAKITGIKEGTIKSHLSRGKEKLANYLRKNGYDGR